MKTLSIYVFSIGLFVLAGNALPDVNQPASAVMVDCTSAAYAARCADDHAEMAKALGTAAPITSPADLPDVLPLHNYPYGKTQYNSRAEWVNRLWSSQSHWLLNGMMLHTHVECAAPIYAQISRLTTFTLPCRAVLFHNPGTVDLGYINMNDLVWETADPKVGDPMGLKFYNFTATFNPTSPTAANAPRPENGWWGGTVVLFTYLDQDLDGLTDHFVNTELVLPFYMVGDPAVPEFVYFGPRLRASTMVFGANHGQAISECTNYLPVLVPITQVITVECSSSVYARNRNGAWPGPQFDTQEQLDDLNIHAGDFGRVVNRIVGGGDGGAFPLTFDPFVKAGARKSALIWRNNSGPGDAAQGIPPNEEMWALLVFDWTADPNGTPPPAPVNCTGSFVKTQTGPLTWTVEFVVTTPASNGGTCTPSFTIGG